MSRDLFYDMSDEIMLQIIESQRRRHRKLYMRNDFNYNIIFKSFYKKDIDSSVIASRDIFFDIIRGKYPGCLALTPKEKL